MAVFGIDISAHNAGLNLQSAKNEGVRFAILRAGYTGYGNGISKAKEKHRCPLRRGERRFFGTR